MIRQISPQTIARLKEFTAMARQRGNVDAIVLENELLLLGYKSIAEEIANRMPEGAKILDWGGGFGFLSFLLNSLGYDVTYYDYEMNALFGPLLEDLAIKKVTLNSESELSFATESFDAVVSCGVLEHVPDMVASLSQLSRVLKNDGRLFIYHFPNKYSYTEYLAKFLGQEVHEIKFSMGNFVKFIKDNGFEVEKYNYRYALPRNLPNFPKLRKMINHIANPIYNFDHFLTTYVPPVRLIATSLNVIAVKIPNR